MAKIHVTGNSSVQSRWHVFQSARNLCGVCYVTTSLGLSIYCLVVLLPYLNNDFIWFDFVTANTPHSILNAFNMQLTLVNSQFDPFNASSALYINENMGITLAYPRMIMYQELTTLESAVNGLRKLQASRVSTMMTQYCWVDLEKRWAMAHTRKRQQRCWLNYQKNGAVYMETVLRNIDYNAWVLTTQNLFYTRIGAGVIETSPKSGPPFFTYLQQHQLVHAADEVAFWKSYGIDTFQLQYSNQYQLGLQENIIIHNAMGASSPFTIKSIANKYRGTMRVTFYMYRGLLNDLKIPTGNQSLVQNSSTYFGLKNENLFETIGIGATLTPVFQAVHAEIGPLCNIDLYWIPIPGELVQIVQSFRATVLSKVQYNSSYSSAFAAVGSYSLHPTPLQWKNNSYRFYGGNPICGFGAPLTFVQESFGFDDACSTQNALTINWNPLSSLFAYVMVKGNVSSVCQLLSNDEFFLCFELLAALKSANVNFSSSLTPTASLIEISFLQFVSVIGNSTVHVQSQRLLDDSFAFFGWMSLYEWALQEREGVSFQGDNGFYPLLSYACSPMVLPKQLITSSVAIYLWYCCGINTVGLVGVAMLLAIITMSHRPQKFEWFMFNRITSATWLNRSFLLLRGAAAVLVMSSSVVVPSQSNGALLFENSHRSLFVSSLLAGEAIWIMYVLQEMLYPLTTSSTACYSRWSSAAVWLLLIAIDVWVPVKPIFSLHRDCYSENMDMMVYCSSGSIEIGSWKRAVLLACIPVFTVILCSIVIAAKPKRISNESVPSLLLSSAAVAFLQSPSTFSAMETRLDVAEAAMVGILGFKLLGKTHFFDTKLWLPLTRDEIVADGGIALLPNALDSSEKSFIGPKEALMIALPQLKKQANNLIILGGVIYVVTSLVSNIAYLNVARSFLSNDFGWADLNSSGMHTFLATQLNAQLLISNNQSIKVTDPSLVDLTQFYNGSSTSIAWSVNAPRRQLNDPATPLRDVVVNLRKMDECKMPWMFTQYCYVDFKRMWPMASSRKRQERCNKAIANGAVYLEAPLRNIRHWDQWRQCWGSSFQLGFENELAQSREGKQWLNSVSSSTTSIDQEVAYWEDHNISSFQLQWQNYKSLGMTDKFFVSSALGYSSPLTLSSYDASYHVRQQTSMRMYWSFASDLWAVSTNATLIGTKSLIATSSNFAFANVSSQSLLFQNLTLISPLNAGLTVLQATLGPFGVVDMKYVFPPTELLNLYSSVLKSINQLLRASPAAQDDFIRIPPKARTCQVPPFLLSNSSILISGGNLMCGNDGVSKSSRVGLFSGFGSTSVCYAYFLEIITPSTIQLLFAMVSLKNTFGLQSSDFKDICDLDMCGGALCATNLNITLQFVEKYATNFSSIAQLVPPANDAAKALNIQSIQYYTTQSALASSALYQINILEPTEKHWSFYGWCLLFDWVTGIREVVEFQGDTASIVSITLQDSFITFTADPAEIPISFASIFLGCSFYITWILVCVAGLVAMYTLTLRGAIEGLNLFELNRIVGHTWAGRTILIFRSITATWMLNTTPVHLTLMNRATFLTSPQLPAYQTILAASEVTWLVYVLNDLFSCVTKQYTTYYAFKSSLSTWIIIATWTLLSPSEIIAKLERKCKYIDMDFALECTSGVIEIGSMTGVFKDVFAAIACVILSFLFERAFFPRRPSLEIHSHLLNAHSLYMLDFRAWRLDGAYFLDKTSAIMAGLISWTYQNHLYILDIKSWRLLVVPVVKGTHLPANDRNFDRFHKAIRLDHF